MSTYHPIRFMQSSLTEKKNILVQGCSSGIGLSFCEYYLKQSPDNKIFGTTRSPNAEWLSKLKNEYPDRLNLYQLDIKSEESIIELKKSVEGDIKKLDMLINVSGILHPSGRGETSIKEVTSENVLETFQINCLGPLLMVKNFVPIMGEGSIVVNISGGTASIKNCIGGWYSQRLAKVGMNMWTKCCSMEFKRKNFIFLSMHPGLVKSKISEPYYRSWKGVITPDEAVCNMGETLKKVDRSYNGTFINSFGETIAW
eukprot:TRINITY_DN5545_c0_g1_i1.p1 TRINITY_DN5545_c0_g1~~TRINITY_DN5545_c0_g1_i1.p1  ORF type:complete len:290 (-),score=41.24 TRINITY_DN5545_c0_g1_i1:158-925(-)